MLMIYINDIIRRIWWYPNNARRDITNILRYFSTNRMSDAVSAG
jgi:hypothetical protein